MNLKIGGGGGGGGEAWMKIIIAIRFALMMKNKYAFFLDLYFFLIAFTP